MAVATTNKDFKQGWIDSYYPYGQYMVQENRLILGGDEIKVNNEILTQQVIEDSTSGFDNSSSIGQTGGGSSVKRKYKIHSETIDGAFRKLEGKVKGGKGDILVLKLESLDDNKKINFYKIYRKKI
jgi:hypothetical protein